MIFLRFLFQLLLIHVMDRKLKQRNSEYLGNENAENSHLLEPGPPGTIPSDTNTSKSKRGRFGENTGTPHYATTLHFREQKRIRFHERDERSFKSQLGAEGQDSYCKTNRLLLICPTNANAKNETATKWSEYFAGEIFLLDTQEIYIFVAGEWKLELNRVKPTLFALHFLFSGQENPHLPLLDPTDVIPSTAKLSDTNTEREQEENLQERIDRYAKTGNWTTSYIQKMYVFTTWLILKMTLIRINSSQQWAEYKRCFWKKRLGDNYESPSPENSPINTTPEFDPEAVNVIPEADANIRKLYEFIKNRKNDVNIPEQIPDTAPRMHELGEPAEMKLMAYTELNG